MKPKNKFVRKVYRRDTEERVEEEYECVNPATNPWNIELERVIKEKDKCIEFLRKKISKQHDENTALRQLLDDALDAYFHQTTKDPSPGEESSKLVWESVNPKKRRKVSSHSNETKSTNNSKEVKEDKINNDGYKILSVDGKYGGEFVYIKGVKQLILTGNRGGKYWIDANGRKRRIQNWYCDKEEDESAYDVEKLLNHRQTEDGMEYFVRWKDFDSTYDSWEPEENFDDDAVIEKYWEEKKKCKKVKMNHFLDQALNNLNGAERYNVKKTMTIMQDGYKEHMVEKVQDKIQFILSKKVTNNLAEFIADFLDECDGNLETELMKGGMKFIKSMKLMMWQKNEEIDESESDDDDEEEQNEHQKNKNNEVDWDNPIPNYVDIITGGNVIKPAISPFGHVLSYDTWRKILESSKCQNMCPFTKKTMNRRSLVKITHRNYLYYKDRIVNITKEQMDVMASMA